MKSASTTASGSGQEGERRAIPDDDARMQIEDKPNELHEVIVREGRVAPHTDPELKRKPQCYARLARDMSLRDLVSFGAPSEATVGVFVVPKKLGKQRLIFDTCKPTFSAAMALCDAHTCILGGLTTPADSATGMSESFILPRVSTHLLLREGVKVPDHLRHLSDVSPQLQVLAMGFSWALYVC